MGESSWTLIDRSDRTHIEQLEITPEMVGGKAEGYRIHKRRLRDGLSEGVDVVHIDNGSLSFDVLPTRGMGLWKAWLNGQQIGWNSPVKGPINPAFVPLTEPSGLGWLEGFDELLVRCGLESNGSPQFNEQGRLVYGLHGRIGNKPAHLVKLHTNGETGEITLTGVVDEVRFHFSKLRLSTTIKTTVGQNVIEIHDTVENLSGSPTDMQMLYHINFGTPLLESGASVVMPVKTMVPRDQGAADALQRWADYGPPTAGCGEQCYLFELQGDTRHWSEVLLKNAQGDCGVSIQFDTRQLPCFTQWKNETSEADGYVTGLEPGTNFPNPRGFEKGHGRVVPLAPHATCSFDLRLEAHPDSETVAEVEKRVKALCQQEPVIHSQPRPDWCADA